MRNFKSMDPQKKFTWTVVALAVAVVGLVAFLGSSASQQLLGFKINAIPGFALRSNDAQIMDPVLNCVVAPCPGDSDGILVTHPEAGELWRTGETQKIVWEETQPADNLSMPNRTAPVDTADPTNVAKRVTITLNKPRPACLDQRPACAIRQVAPYVIAENLINQNGYAWSIPVDLPDAYLGESMITVTMNDTQISGVSNIFKIERRNYQSNFNVTSPAAGERWKQGETYKIVWTANPRAGLMARTARITFVPAPMGCGIYEKNIYCRPYDIEPYLITTKAADTGVYEWTVPKDLNPMYLTGGQIEVQINGTTLAAQSARFFLEKPAVPALQIFSPASGERWQMGKEYKITWNHGSVISAPTSARKTVSLYLNPANTYCSPDYERPCYAPDVAPYVITESAPNNGVFVWKIPTDLGVRFQGKQQITLRVNDPNMNQAAQSAGFFIDPALIVDPPPVTRDVQITTTAMDKGVAGEGYNFQFRASGGKAPYTWTASVTPRLQSWVVDASSGMFSAKLPTAGSYKVQVNVTDRLGKVASKTFILNVLQAMVDPPLTDSDKSR